MYCIVRILSSIPQHKVYTFIACNGISVMLIKPFPGQIKSAQIQAYPFLITPADYKSYSLSKYTVRRIFVLYW